MRTPFQPLSWLLTLILLAIIGLALLIFLDSRPLVPLDQPLSAADRAWAKQWLATARPRGLRDGERVTLSLSEREANILASYLIDKLGQGRVAVRLEQDQGRLAASLGLPWDPNGSFINLELTLVAAEPLPRIAQARLAGLPLPAGLVETLAGRLMEALDQSRLLQHVDIRPELALLTYEWHRDALANVGSGLVSADDRARMIRYQGLLVSDLAERPKRDPVPLSELLTLVVAAAAEPTGGDPVAENRAAILALAAYVNRQTIRDPTAGQVDSPHPVFRPVLLGGRRDLAQHFMTSAALAAQGGAALSDLVGLFKEVSDSQGGSGFSFPDLAADRAGTRFAMLATGDTRGARAAQAAARSGLTEDHIMPSIADLPEGMNQTAFAAAFKDTRSPAYRRITDRIDRSIDALPLFQKATR